MNRLLISEEQNTQFHSVESISSFQLSPKEYTKKNRYSCELINEKKYYLYHKHLYEARISLCNDQYCQMNIYQVEGSNSIQHGDQSNVHKSYY